MPRLRTTFTAENCLRFDPYEVGPDGISCVKEDLLRRASRRIGRAAPVLSDVLTKGDVVASLTIAIEPERYGFTRQESAAWLWIAAASGDRESYQRWRATSAAEGGALPPNPPLSLDDEVHQALAELAEERGGPGVAAGQEAVGAALAEEGGAPPPAEEGGAPPPAEDVGGFGAVVLGRIGDANSREGRDIAARFKGVADTCLPFSGLVPEPDAVGKAILARWPWLRAVARQVEEHFAILRLAGRDGVFLRPLLFVGPPGCGKSSVASYVCDLLGLESTIVPCGGASDAVGLASVTRGWSTARPGAVALALLECRVANPAFILDELDKSPKAGAQNGSAQGALLAILEKGRYRDSYLLASVDTAQMTFVATANKLSGIDPALRERFQVIRFEEPAAEHFDVLFANCRADFSGEWDIHPQFLPAIGADGRAVLAKFLKQSGSARTFRSVFDILIGDLIRRAEQRRILH